MISILIIHLTEHLLWFLVRTLMQTGLTVYVEADGMEQLGRIIFMILAEHQKSTKT
jgi:hypothetical protein